MHGVAVGLPIAIVVGPGVGERALAVDALRVMDVEVALVARAHRLASLLAHGAPRRVEASRTLAAVELALCLIDVEVVVLLAEFALVGACEAVAQVARVALREAVRVTASYRDGLASAKQTG